LRLPKGTRLDLSAFYDNSPDNPNRPPKSIGFGPQTTDEMCICFFTYTVDAEHLTQGKAVENDGLEIRF
jgi:hypothetical protein